MISDNPQDVILYARSSFYLSNTCLLYTVFLILNNVLVFNPEKMRESLPLHYLS